MKKTFKNIRTLAALLMAGAAFAACSSDDSIVENQQPANPSEQVYTLTIKASNGDATTRALDLDGTGKLTASWANGDVLTVYNVTQDVALSGSLTASNASGSTADFTGTLSGPINKDDVLTLTYHPIFSVQAFQSQDGTLKGNKGAEKYDMATATVTVNTIPVLGEITIKETEASFTTKVAMIKLTLQDNEATPNKLNATSLNVKATFTIDPYPAITENVLTFTIPASTYTDTDGGNGILYFALPSAATVANQLAAKYSAAPYNLSLTPAKALTELNAATITFTATVGGKTYTVDKTGYKFAAGKYYAATLTMATYNETKSINDGPVTVAAGEHWLITGTGTQTNNTMSIGAGATVTLDGVNISSDGYCIKCAGSATIILKDGSTNTLTSTSQDYPALWAGDAGTTLTIQGSTGVLNVTSGEYCAGIGGGYSNTNSTCGNIRIEGGVITAQGGNSGAGIGSDCCTATCGDIIITGGTVTATGGTYAAGIGTGYGDGDGNVASCGSITITNGVTKVTAARGANAINSIGKGYGGNASCGTVTIDGVVNATTLSTFEHFTSTVSGNTWTLTHK